MAAPSFHESTSRGREYFPIDFFHVDEKSPHYEMPFHWHKDWEIIHIVRGTFDLTVDSYEFHAVAGDYLFVNEGAIHGGTPHGCVYECIVFEPRMLFHQTPIARNYLQPNYNQQRMLPRMLPRDDTEGAKLLNLFFRSMQNQGAGRELGVFGLLCLIIDHIDRKDYWIKRDDISSSPRKLRLTKDLMDYLEENYTQDLTLAMLAEKAGMSPRYFCRFFKEMTGKTPIEYLNYYRIERAALDLATTCKSVTEAAFDNGFHDLNYFIRCFKRQKGITPGQFMHQDLSDRPKIAEEPEGSS